MFLAGKKSSILKSEISTAISCTNCKTSGTTKITVLGFYKHLLQIPFISGGKSGISSCSKCKQNYELKNMPAAIKLAYYELKETLKTPIWFYTGLIVLKTLILIKIFSKYY